MFLFSPQIFSLGGMLDSHISNKKEVEKRLSLLPSPARKEVKPRGTEATKLLSQSTEAVQAVTF